MFFDLPRKYRGEFVEIELFSKFSDIMIA